MQDQQQIFVIAKINGRYRCLSVLYHRFYRGTKVMRYCLSQIKLFSSPENRSNIRHELKYAASLPKSFWNNFQNYADNSKISREKRIQRFVPFPFITTCHILGTTNLDEIWGCTKEDGITVVDITDPARVSYCFASTEASDAERKKVRLRSPLSAAEYLAGHNNMRQIPTNSDCLDEFASLPVMDYTALKETWPQVDWKKGTGSGLQLEAGDSSFDTLTQDPQPPETPAYSAVPTLRSLAFKKVLDAALSSETGTDLSWLTSAELLSDFPKKVKEKLYQEPISPRISSKTVTLLAKAVAEEDIVDLSPFRALNQAQILHVLDQSVCTSLDLAGLNVTIDVLKQILRKMPQLESLNVMGARNLSLSDLSDAISGSANKLRNLSHSRMFSKHFEYLLPGDEVIESSEPALMYGSISPVVQLLYVHNAQSFSRSRLPNGGIPLTRIQNELRSLALYLGGTFLPIEKLIISLVNQIKLLGKHAESGECIHTCTTKAFAKAGSIVEDVSSGEFWIDKTVSALPAFACIPATPNSRYQTGEDHTFSTGTPKQGEWTVITIDERHDDNKEWKSYPTEMKPLGLRYAFVTSSKCSTSSTLNVDMTIPKESRGSLLRKYWYEANRHNGIKATNRSNIWDETGGHRLYDPNNEKFPNNNTPAETCEYKDPIIIADLEQFLSMTLPGNGNELLRRRLTAIWNENMDSMETEVKKIMEVRRRHGIPGSEPTVVNKTSVCCSDEVEEALRFFLKAQ